MNHYAENNHKPIWSKTGLLTQQMTGFLFPLKDDGTAPTVYDSGIGDTTLGEDAVTAMQGFFVPEETDHRSCSMMAVNVDCPEHPTYSHIANNVYDTAMFLHGLKKLPDNAQLTPKWIEDTAMNGTFI